MINLLLQLQQFYKEDPSDPFNIYALAIEYLKTDLMRSKALFEELLNNHSTYIAAYYHAAALYIQLNEMELAESTYKEGIEMAQKLHKNHALSELKRAYQSFLDELED